ncbi:uncharacterized protein LOC112055740 isoform X2 [Bicyclus anynana]|uniref:Uncharacterized protein LOC112055740 isoform X2 n=1 Tax=Bicyclus anynana TaxID=110368 RepID=A0ABM3LHH7_BICAN|nr:uncharacterized protein LOC112055740 isoform X2 [Bicyclus anynana]
MVVGESKRTNIMDGIENTGDVRLHDHRLRLKQRFDIVRKLGQGTYGKVQLGINKKTGQEVAIKTIKKCKIETEADLIRIRREVQIMSSVRHPNIVHIYEVFENSEKMILVMEYCSGGELYDYLSQKKVLEEDEARRLFRQIATAVYYCHIHKICHRDLKLENVLLDDTGSAKIADFGLSNVFKETSLLSTFCGSPLYASPEIVKGTPYIGPEVDCWSLGVLLYTLVYGAMPFDGSNFKRLVRQISNGDYYEPKNPSTASPLIRDMLTVDPLKRADIAYICDNPWVNMGYETSCLEMSEALAAETPVRLDLLLSLAPAAPSSSNSVVVPEQADLGPEESCTDLTSSTSMAVEPSNSAEKRILELVAEGGEDAIKPSPTRTLVAAADNKRKYDAAMSASGLLRKKERVASCASVAPISPALPEEDARQASPPPEEDDYSLQITQPTLKSSATMTISPAPTMPPQPVMEPPAEIISDVPKDEPKEQPKPKLVIKKKPSPPKVEERTEKSEEPKAEEPKPLSVSSTADKLTSLTLTQPTPAPASPAKPKKLSIPGGHVGSFKEQFERRASLTTAPDTKRNLSKPVSKIAKPKAQSEDRELTLKSPDNGTVRLQQIGIEPTPLSPQTPIEEMNRGGVKKTESEPANNTAPLDPAVVLQDARRSLQNSMAKLAEERAGEDNRRRAARDIISTAIRTGKPPVPYGRSSSAGVASLASPPSTPSAPAPATAPVGSASSPRVFRTEAMHSVKDHRNRGVSVERIIPITMSGEEPPPQQRSGHMTPVTPLTPATPATPVTTPPGAVTSPTAHARITQTPLRRLASTESTGEAVSPSTGEPIKKSAREFIIPIAVEGKGYVTPRQRSLEPEQMPTRLGRSTAPRPRRISSLVSGGESEEEDDTHMHRLRSTRAARAESVSSGEEDEEDEGFHLLTADNLFSTLLHRVRALTQRLNGEEGPGFQHHPHSIFNNLQSPFFNSPHLPRRHLLREGWGSRELHAPFDSMFNKARSPMPRGSSKKTAKHQTRASQTTDATDGLDLSDLDLSSIEFSEREMQALSGLTPALSRRLQRQLLAHLPPQAAARLRRTLSLHAAKPAAARPPYARSHSASKTLDARSPDDSSNDPSVQTQHPSSNDANVTNTTEQIENAAKEDRLVIDSEMKTLEEIDIPSKASKVNAEVDVKTSKEKEVPVDDESVIDIKTIDSAEVKTAEDNKASDDVNLSARVDTPETKSGLCDIARFKSEDASFSAPQFCTLPRLRRRSTLSRESLSPTSEFGYGSAKLESLSNESVGSKNDCIRRTPDRPLLSKYLAPERHLSLDETYSSDSGSILSEPSYIAAYGAPALNNTPGLGFRRHSLRLTGDQPKKRISRFLRSDFFDTSMDDSIYAKHKKEKELETQKILKEIRDKKNKSLESASKSPNETLDEPESKDDYSVKKCLSPIGNLLLKDRSRSTTPYFPILDNIKESSLDSSTITSEQNQSDDFNQQSVLTALNKESKMIRPKSYPIKSFDLYEDTNQKSTLVESCKNPDNDVEDKKINRESKLLRPKSYPTSTPSPEKVCVNRNLKKDDTKSPKELTNTENKADVEVSFSVTLPKKFKTTAQSDSQKKLETTDLHVDSKLESIKEIDSTLTLKKYQVVNQTDDKTEKECNTNEIQLKNVKNECVKNGIIKEETKSNSTDNQSADKKGIVKKKIVKKVSIKSKTDSNANDTKATDEKKKVTKKVKEKVNDENAKTAAPKKKSVFQSIGQKLEKLASSKSNSPEKNSNNDTATNESIKINRTQRENSVPVNVDPPTESNLIKRAVTITDVAALDNQNITQNKTTVSKVLGLFKKFEPKDKNIKPAEKINTETGNVTLKEILHKHDNAVDHSLDSEEKPKRPTSLLLNGLGRKTRLNRTSSDAGNAVDENDEYLVVKKENDSKNIKNSLKLDFSRLPRVKKIVPTSPVIEPQIMNSSSVEKNVEVNCLPEKNGSIPDGSAKEDIADLQNRSRSRSRSTFSNSDVKSESSGLKEKYSLPDSTTHHIPLRSLDSISPEKEDVVDRIRRKSFYSRFNEKKQRRKSNLVGPGAIEYDPLARIHSHSNESKYDASPSSPGNYDLSPGLSVGSDISPSTERYRSLLTDLPSTRTSLRYDGINDKIDMYRSLDRNDFRKHPGRSYLDYDQPSSYSTNRYARTKSLFDSSDTGEDQSFSLTKEPHKYNRTNSLFSPGSYATYRPKRTRNSAIILKESEKEPSPENILDKIRQRKISISVTRKSDSEKDSVPRSIDSPKGESDCSERSSKVD